MSLQTPSVLAQLPRPLHATTGKTQISEVYSLADSKKRKRYEVAVAVDGEAVNIYNIQTPKLVTSYAVPPQSSFSCQPCSLRRKSPNGSVVKRQTYVAVKKQIKSFLEESGRNGSSAPTISSSSFSIEDTSSPTTFIGIVPGDNREDGETDPFDILVVHGDGRVRRLSPDLETQRWSIRHSEIAKNSSVQDVQCCFLMDFDEARKSLFKRRPDLISLALGDFTNPSRTEPSVLLLVSYPPGPGKIKLSEVTIQVFSVPANAPPLTKSLDESQKMRHLLTFALLDIEEEGEFERRDLHWYFHPGSAGLNISFEKGFVNFDLSQYTPLVTSKFILNGESFSSVMRITPLSVIGSGKSVIALYDTQYKSIHRSIAVDDLPETVLKSAGAKTSFITYFAKLDVVIAMKGSALLAFDLGSSQTGSGSSMKRARDGLLVNAIGRGIGSDGVSKKHCTDNLATLGLTSSDELDKWNKLMQELGGYSKTNDENAFDRAVQNYFGVGETKTLPSPGAYVNQEMVLSLLSHIFHVERNSSNDDKLSASSSFHISISTWPHETCRWLIQLGYLYPDIVETALRRSSKPRILPPPPTGSFIQTIKDSDPSLQRLVSILQGPAVFSTNDLAHALKMLINTARSCSIPDEESVKAITNGTSTAAVSPNNDEAVSLTKNQAPLQAVFLGLNVTLQKIHTQPQQAITSSIRSILSKHEIITLIHHLRLSLATGGHTSRFTENPPTPIMPDLINPPLSLDAITDLLNASVDAIGPSGWISAADFTDSLPRDMDLIAEMKSEISAALEGVQEATHLTGILREYLKYANRAASTDSALNRGSQLDDSASASVQHQKLNGADLLVFGVQGGEDGDREASGKLLPLSLRASSEVSKTKMDRSGKMVRRSKREIGYLRRKAVGKYTFEKLIL